MGLDTTHDCWHGAYSAFTRWRTKLAEAAGIPLFLMDGYYIQDDQWTNSSPPLDALAWAAPGTDGRGPACGSHYGPALHNWITGIARWLPISWDVLKDDPLLVLLNHSDCEGEILAKDCAPLADRLEALLPLLTGDGGGHIGSYQEKTRTFITGLREAAAAGENVGFH